MSAKVYAAVWKHSKHKGGALLLLLALADHADDEGVCWPGVKRLASMCKVTERQIGRLLVELRESGELAIEFNRGERLCNRYRITVGLSSLPTDAPTTQPLTQASPLTPTTPLASMSPLTPTSQTPDAHVRQPLTPTSPKPSLNPQEPSFSSAADSVDQKGIPKKRNLMASAAQPEDVDASVWGDFLALRNKLRAPLTETALAGIRSEAAKAGWSLEEALRECCARGWRGFKADWVSRRAAPGLQSSDWQTREAQRANNIAALTGRARPTGPVEVIDV